jgi:hypothetical protein
MRTLLRDSIAGQSNLAPWVWSVKLPHDGVPGVGFSLDAPYPASCSLDPSTTNFSAIGPGPSSRRRNDESETYHQPVAANGADSDRISAKTSPRQPCRTNPNESQRMPQTCRIWPSLLPHMECVDVTSSPSDDIDRRAAAANRANTCPDRVVCALGSFLDLRDRMRVVELEPPTIRLRSLRNAAEAAPRGSRRQARGAAKNITP